MEEKKKPEKDAQKEQAQQSPKPAKKQLGGNFLLYGILAATIIFNIILAFILISMIKPKDITEKEAEAKLDSLKAEKQAESEIGGITQPVEGIVNIAGTNAERFLKVAVRFEFDEKKYPKMEEDIKRISPKLKDLLIEIISPLTLSELNEPETRIKIRQQMLRAANNAFSPSVCQFKDVLIDQFIIQ